MAQTWRGPRTLAPGAVARWTVALLVLASACSSDGQQTQSGPDKEIDLPGAARPTNFDDLTYSSRLRRVLVPALDAGLYLVDPVSAQVTRFEGLGAVYSAAEGEGMVLIGDRRRSTVAAVDVASGRVVVSTPTAGPPDYVRYVPETAEVWVTEKGRRPGIEIFRLGQPDGQTLTPNGFISIPEEPEGLTIAGAHRRAYTQSSDGRVLAIDVERREVVGRWPTGCDESHGIPAVDDERGLLLAGCVSGGEVVLLDVNHEGKRLGTYSVSGDEALMAHAPGEQFYVRADPGAVLATLDASPGVDLEVVRTFAVPRAGHCLTADDLGHVWTCDQRGAKLLRYTDG